MPRASATIIATTATTATNTATTATSTATITACRRWGAPTPLHPILPPLQPTDRLTNQPTYQHLLQALERAKNDRLWFKTNLKLCNLWSKKQEYGRMSKILKDLQRCAQQGRPVYNNYPDRDKEGK